MILSSSPLRCCLFSQPLCAHHSQRRSEYHPVSVRRNPDEQRHRRGRAVCVSVLPGASG